MPPWRGSADARRVKPRRPLRCADRPGSGVSSTQPFGPNCRNIMPFCIVGPDVYTVVRCCSYVLSFGALTDCA